MSIVVAVLAADRPRAERIVAAMVNSDVDVQLRVVSPGGPDWRRDVQAVLAARCALFCWTAASVADAEFCSLAAQAVRNAIAIGVQLEDGAAPPPEANMTLYQLTAWQLGPRNWLMRLLLGDQFLRDLVMAAKAKASGLDPPPPSARVHVARASAIRALLGIAAAMATLSGVLQLLAYGPWPHPKEDAAWAAIRSGQAEACADIEAFVAGYPRSDRVAAAQAALANRRSMVAWTRRERPFPVPEPIGLPERSATEAAARAAANARQAAAAGEVCAGAAENLEGRLESSRLADVTLQCVSGAGGWTCAGSAKAQCAILEPARVTVCDVRPPPPAIP